MIEFDVDMGYLLDEGGNPRTVVLNDENGDYKPMRFVRERTCELGIKETKFENGTFETYVCTACGYEPFRQYLFDNGDFIAQPRPNYCPNCGAHVEGGNNGRA